MMSNRSRRYNPHVHPTARDRAIFAYIAAFGVASLAQLHRRFWPQAKVQTCADRLAKLVSGGFLHTEVTTARGEPEPIFWIERKASLLFDQPQRARFVKGRPPTAEMAHILRTADVVEAIGRKSQIVGFTNEHHLKGEEAKKTKPNSRVRHVADGRVTILQRGAAHAYLIEIDGAYYGKRLQQKAKELGRLGEQVLWVVYSPRRLATISRVAASYPTIRPVLFTSL